MLWYKPGWRSHPFYWLHFLSWHIWCLKSLIAKHNLFPSCPSTMTCTLQGICASGVSAKDHCQFLSHITFSFFTSLCHFSHPLMSLHFFCLWSTGRSSLTQIPLILLLDQYWKCSCFLLKKMEQDAHTDNGLVTGNIGPWKILKIIRWLTEYLYLCPFFSFDLK